MKTVDPKFFATAIGALTLFSLTGCLAPSTASTDSTAKVNYWSGSALRISPWRIAIMSGVETRIEAPLGSAEIKVEHRE